MTEHTGTSLHDLVIRTFATVETKDLEAMMSLFADDAVFFRRYAVNQLAKRIDSI